MLAFLNILGFVAALFVTLGAGSLLLIHVLPHLALLPSSLLETAGYGLSACLLENDRCLSRSLIRPRACRLLSVLGALLLPVMIGISLALHTELSPMRAIQLISQVGLAIYTYEAIRLDSQFMGLLSVASLFQLVYQYDIFFPFTSLFGLEDKASVYRSLAIGLLLMASYLSLHCLGCRRAIRPYKVGVLLYGNSVYLISCLIVQSRWFAGTSKPYYWGMALAFVSALALLYLGSSVPGLEYLTGTSATFSILIVLEKYCEIPWERLSWSLGALGFGLLLFGLVFSLQQSPSLVKRLTFNPFAETEKKSN
jgi:hypothetical protein